MKKILKSIFDKLGYTVLHKESITPKDLRGQVNNPLYARYSARKYSFLINADFKKCIVINRFSCEKEGTNPLVNTVTEYIAKGSIKYPGSKLEDFYNRFTPKNVAEMFNLKGELHKNLIRFPANYFVPPWENADMQSKKKYRVKNVKSESAKRGKKLPLNNGWVNIGPISKEMGSLEIRTLVRLTKSITANGYLRGNSRKEDIRASILVNADDYKYIITDGTHRISVLSALNYKIAPIKVHPTSIPAFIYRDEVDFWPNVKNGLYTKNQALKVFDDIFQGVGSH